MEHEAIIQLLVYLGGVVAGNWVVLSKLGARLAVIEERLGGTGKDVEEAKESRQRLWSVVDEHGTRITRLEERV